MSFFTTLDVVPLSQYDCVRTASCEDIQTCLKQWMTAPTEMTSVYSLVHVVKVWNVTSGHSCRELILQVMEFMKNEHSSEALSTNTMNVGVWVVIHALLHSRRLCTDRDKVLACIDCMHLCTHFCSNHFNSSTRYFDHGILPSLILPVDELLATVSSTLLESPLDAMVTQSDSLIDHVVRLLRIASGVGDNGIKPHHATFIVDYVDVLLAICQCAPQCAFDLVANGFRDIIDPLISALRAMRMSHTALLLLVWQCILTSSDPMDTVGLDNLCANPGVLDAQSQEVIADIRWTRAAYRE